MEYGNVYFLLCFSSLLTGFPFPRAPFPKVLVAMTDIDPVHRLSLDAKEVKDRLGIIVKSMPPASLLIKPDNAEHGLPNIQLIIIILVLLLISTNFTYN